MGTRQTRVLVQYWYRYDVALFTYVRTKQKCIFIEKKRFCEHIVKFTCDCGQRMEKRAREENTTAFTVYDFYVRSRRS